MRGSMGFLLGVGVFACTVAVFAPAASAQGLTGQYYNDSMGITAAMTPPGSSSATPSATATLVLTRTDAPAGNFDFDWTTVSPGGTVQADNFFVVWTGDIRANATGAWTFGTRADDGTRVWVNGTLVLDNWVAQGQPAAPNMGTATVNLTSGAAVTIRAEFFEAGGNANFELWWRPPGGVDAQVPTSVLSPPAAAPGAPVLTATAGYTPGGQGQVALSWTAPAGATDYTLQRGTVSGGPYTTLASGLTGTTYTDLAVTFGTTYYYIVRAFAGSSMGPNSNQAFATPVPPPPKTTTSGSNNNLAHRCGCDTIADPAGALALAGAALLALALAFMRRR